MCIISPPLKMNAQLSTVILILLLFHHKILVFELNVLSWDGKRFFPLRNTIKTVICISLKSSISFPPVCRWDFDIIGTQTWHRKDHHSISKDILPPVRLTLCWLKIITFNQYKDYNISLTTITKTSVT